MPRANDHLLRAKGIHKSYRMGSSEVAVLRGASLTADAGEFVAIMGSSGCGKSTLLHILGALDEPVRGDVEFGGWSVFSSPGSERNRYRNCDVGFVFQFYHLLPELTVLENVLSPRLVGQSIGGWWATRRTAKKEACELLEKMGLMGRLKHRPRELSGGERQRVAIARALVNRPSLLLADEPTGNLDETIGAQILSLLVDLNRGGQTIVMVTHDAKVAACAHRVLRLSDGVLRESAADDRGGRSVAVPAREVAP